jgi:hypothetical protein
VHESVFDTKILPIVHDLAPSDPTLRYTILALFPMIPRPPVKPWAPRPKQNPSYFSSQLYSQFLPLQSLNRLVKESLEIIDQLTTRIFGIPREDLHYRNTAINGERGIEMLKIGTDTPDSRGEAIVWTKIYRGSNDPSYVPNNENLEQFARFSPGIHLFYMNSI